MSKWTFEIVSSWDDKHAFVHDQDGKFVCNVDISQGLHNLYLIVNAPDLLEAAELGLKAVQDASYCVDTAYIEKAIEDATAGMWDNKPKEGRK